MLSIYEVEQFIFDTFCLCFGGRKCTRKGHVQDQREYLLGCIETLHRRGDITDELHEYYRLQYYYGHSAEYAAEQVFGEGMGCCLPPPMMADPDSPVILTEIPKKIEIEIKDSIVEDFPPIQPGSINEAVNRTDDLSPPSFPI